MYQIDVLTAAATLPVPAAAGTPGYFTDGDVVGGVAPTVVPADFLNALMLENLGLVVGAGITPQKNANNQVLLAVKALANQAVANYAVPLRPFADGTSAPASTLYVDRAVGQVGGYFQDTGSTANAYVIALNPAVTAYDHSVSFKFRTVRANTGPATIDFGAGPISLRKENDTTLTAGDLPAGSITAVTYDPAFGHALITESVFSQFGTLAKENIGQGLEDDGSGNLRVKLADLSIRRTTSGVQLAQAITSTAAALSVTSASNGGIFRLTGASPTVSLPLSTGLFNGFEIAVIAQGGAATVTPNAADKINNAAAGAVFTILQNQTVSLVTDGAGNWYPLFANTPTGAYSPLYVNASSTLGAGTYQVDTSAAAISITLPGAPTTGTTLEFADPFGTWGTNNLTISGNGATILGSSASLVCDVSGEVFRLIYNGSDWRLF